MARTLAQVDLNKRAIFSKTSNVTIVYWHWTKENFGASSNVTPAGKEDELLDKATAYVTGVIDNDISNCNITKNIEQASASFSIDLLPSQNWRQIISPGDWLAIFFHAGLETTEGGIPLNTKNMVLVGNVDRVARSIQKDEETDTTQLRYTISGRNFGKVFEQTDVWYDPYTVQDKTLDVMLRKAGLDIAGNPAVQVNAAINVFLGSGETFKEGKTTSLNQWMVPAGLSQLLGDSSAVSLAALGVSAGGLFEPLLDRQIPAKLPGYNPRNMITPSGNGSVWEFIKRSCNDMVNEVYLEEVRDNNGNVKPTIVMKPRPFQTPFFKDSLGGESTKLLGMLGGAYKSIQDLAKESFIEISQSEVIYENLGRDDHSRINMLWLTTQQQQMYMLGTTANIDETDRIGNPTFNRTSIRRHGLRRMESLLEFCHTETDGKEGRSITTNIDLFKAFIGQLYDMNAYNHLYEQGTIECSGVLEAELGKALVIKSSLESQPDKVYFIEGYEHKWTYPNTWTTTFTVTKGQFLNTQNIFIDVMGEGDFGQADNSLDLSFVAKTQGRK